jgi:hypothetical protein
MPRPALPNPARYARFAGLFLCALLLAGCRPGDDATVLSTHEVPPARAQAIADAINATLAQDADQPKLGYAEVASPGMLLVRAPSSLQASIGESVAALKGPAGAAAGPAQVQVDTWWLSEQAEGAALPAELSGVVDALEVQGDTLRLRDRVSLGVATSDRVASANGDWMLLQVRAFPEGEAITLDLDVRQSRADPGRVGGTLQYVGRVRTTPGEFIVLTSRPNTSGGTEALVLRVRSH